MDDAAAAPGFRDELVEEPDRAVARGFDHHAAWQSFLMAVLGAVVLACLGLPIAIALLGTAAGVAAWLGIPLLVLAGGRLLRYELTLDRHRATLEQTFAGLRYRRRTCALGGAEFQVWAHGDRGEDGEPPPTRYCELTGGDIAAPLGSPRGAERLAAWLGGQRARLGGSAKGGR